MTYKEASGKNPFKLVCEIDCQDFKQFEDVGVLVVVGYGRKRKWCNILENIGTNRVGWE